MTEKRDLVAIAKNQRHMKLLEKMQTGKALNPGELRELERLEAAANMRPGVVNTREQVAKNFGVVVRTVDNWLREGMPRTQDGNYDLAEITAWKAAREEARGGQAGEKTSWEIKYRAARTRLAELELEIRTGQYLPKDQVERDRVERILTVKTALLALPARLAPQVVGLDVAHAESIIKKRVIEIIESFARGADGTVAVSS